MSVSGWATKSRTALSLGLTNIARVGLYRARLRMGAHPVQRVREVPPPRAPFFRNVGTLTALHAPRWTSTGGLAFGWRPIPRDTVPDWHENVLTGDRAPGAEASWWTLSDFDPSVGDVKGVWELSRLDWVVTFAQQAAAGDCEAMALLNGWLDSWSIANPPYRGHNWKCAQEASIRVLHLAVAALILEQAAVPCDALVELVRIHAARIAPTIEYARAQDNNHGTSEAAALFVAGSWLASHAVTEAEGWERRGRSLLAERLARLVASDGTFSQYSTNYHRLVLDTLSVAECWRRQRDLPPFDAGLVVRAGQAVEWLQALVDPSSGDVPNVGANDGADLLRLTDAGYRDFRPSVQLAAALFRNENAFPASDEAQAQLGWLRVATPVTTSPPRASRTREDGGFAVLHRAAAMVLFRYPRFRFRPAHADALHVDLWHASRCILRDGGTFSYASDSATLDYFSGACGHNGIQFDGRQQMPRLGRFLWGDWLETSGRGAPSDDGDTARFWASYVDRRGGRHRRDVELSASTLRVIDTISGVADRAVLRWRLQPDTWRVEGSTAVSEHVSITVDAGAAPSEVALADGWESRFYGVRTTLPVLEVTVRSDATIVTDVEWSA